VAGDGDEVGAEPIHPDGVGQAQTVRDLDRAVVAVAEVLGAGVDAVLGGQGCRSGGVEHVVHRRGAAGEVGLEAVHDPPPVQRQQAPVRCSCRGERQLGDLSGGEDAVLGQDPGQPPVTRGEVGGEVGVVLAR